MDTVALRRMPAPPVLVRASAILALLLLGSTAWADLAKVTETADATYYVDTGSIVVEPDVHRATVVQDYETLQADGVRSRRVIYEIDCGAERLRSIAVTEHVDPMAGGAALRSSDAVSSWAYVTPVTGTNIPPRTPYRAIVRFVCASRAHSLSGSPGPEVTA